jgi:hypothetical protein
MLQHVPGGFWTWTWYSSDCWSTSAIKAVVHHWQGRHPLETGSANGRIREPEGNNTRMFQFDWSKAGRVHYRSDIVEAKVGDWIPACPSVFGGHNWQA